MKRRWHCCDWNKDEAKDLHAVVMEQRRSQGFIVDWNKDEAKVLDAVVIGTKMKPRF